ncbi:MAG TPA: TOMM precursor leader peptide-binding protein [Planosporangium sp.]|jgi:bacteriocin biosynthesis cyclodehydratase domain-containing protein|nr:TOMM precursor leader peptide-binding protein [Planosporangium sp.]
MDRPTLLPHLRPLWRDRTTLQLGTDPDRAIIVEFAQPVSARILGLLNGARTERAIFADAAALGISAEEVAAVLAALRQAGVLIGARALLPPGLPDARRRRLAAEATALAMRRLPPAACPDDPAAGTPAQLLRRRALSRVLVTGQARLTAPIAATLAAAGVGHVATRVPGPVTGEDVVPGGLSATDLGRPAAEAVPEAVARVAPDVDVTPLSPDDATLVVRVGFDPTPAALAAQAYARRRLPHLTVAVRDGAVVVGPFVPPAGSPCLACLDLHRRDRDPAWESLAAQLVSEPVPSQACAATTTLIGVGYAAAEVLVYLDGGSPRSRGATIEIDGAGGERRRSWPPHPRCDCRRIRRPLPRTGKN